MTVKLLMDWPDSRNGRQYVAGNLLTTDAGTETGLVNAKMATSDLTGGTNYVAPVPQTQYRDAKLATDAGGNVVGIADPVGGGTMNPLDFFSPPVDSVLSKYGKTAYDITLVNVTPTSATNMTWSRTSDKPRFSNQSIKIQPTADTGCIMSFASMAMTCDPVDLLYSVDLWVETLPPTYPALTPLITLTLSVSAGLGANYTQWTFDNSNLRQGWNTLKMWAGDDTTGGYRDSNLPQGCTRTNTGTGFDFTQPCNYFAIRFGSMNGYTVHLDQVRRGAKAKTKIVFGMDATGSGSSDSVFIDGLAPLFKSYKIQPYFTYTWVYDALYSSTTSWNRAVTLYRDWKWDAINHTWSHGATVEGRRNQVTIATVADLATVTFSAAHSIPIGKQFKANISGATPAACNGSFWMVATTTTQATYTATGSGTGAATGTIYLTTLLSELWTSVNAEDQRLLTHEIADTSALMRASGMGRGAHLLAWPNNSVPELSMTQVSCAAAGVCFGRGGRQGNVNVNEFGIDNPLHFGAWPFESSALLYTTQTTLKKKILGAIGRGDSIFLFGHFILDETTLANIAHAGANLEFPPGQGGNPAPPAAGATNADGGWWYLGQMRQFLAWLQPYRDAGSVEVVGYRDFANLMGYGVGK